MAEGNWGSAGMHKVDIRNDLMFSYVMRNPEICTELLEVLLPGHKIARVEYIELESERDGAPQAAQNQNAQKPARYAKGSIERNR